MLNLEILKQAVMDSRDGITISDNCAADNPLIFVNPAFERLTGYSFEEITNVNCRYLQNNDRDQPELEIIHKAIEEGEHCLVTLRNYRKDGTMFWNELSISPIYGEKGDRDPFSRHSKRRHKPGINRATIAGSESVSQENESAF